MCRPNGRIARGEAFQSCSLNEPPGSELSAPAGKRIGHQIGVKRNEFPRLQFRDYRVLKEGSGTARLRRIGQFLGTKISHSSFNFSRRYRRRISVGKERREAFISRHRLPNLRKHKGRLCNDEARPGLGLEDARAITKIAFCRRQGPEIIDIRIINAHPGDSFGHFNAVGTGILDDRAADRAGNGCEIFESA